MMSTTGSTCATKMAKIRFRQSRLIYGRTVSTESFRNSSRATPAHGKQLFESRGCLACHSIGEGDNKIGGTFAANLQKVGEKANFDYIVRWIHNPRERYAPYCPKEKRDLTADDYAKHKLPYVFDTELHSRCPNDGAELQVQNMTVMPNFRLSETDARDIATYLSRFLRRRDMRPPRSWTIRT